MRLEDQEIMDLKKNAVEAWPFLDTVNIGIGQSAVNKSGWYESFAELSQETEIPFFNQRTRSGVGIMYNNMDSAEQVSYGFMCYSIGVEVNIPSMADLTPTYPVLIDQSNSWNYPTFVDMMKHAAFRLQVSQDEKMLAQPSSLPAGSGSPGFFTGENSSQALTAMGSYHSYSNGIAHYDNRYKLANPIAIPRNRNIAGALIFSTYARECLSQLEGPGYTPLNNAALGGDLEEVAIEACCQLRVTLYGKREVQLRNEQRFM